MAEQVRQQRWWTVALVTVPATVLLGSASGWLSDSGYGNHWFDALAKPAFMPPGRLFGVAWTILYTLLGLAAAIAISRPPSRLKSAALALFAGQLLLNFSWSPIFFAGHDIRLALLVIIAMFFLAAGATAIFWTLSRTAALLMLPYLAWLGFAAALTLEIGRLNPASSASLIS